MLTSKSHEYRFAEWELQFGHHSNGSGYGLGNMKKPHPVGDAGLLIQESFCSKLLHPYSDASYAVSIGKAHK